MMSIYRNYSNKRLPRINAAGTSKNIIKRSPQINAAGTSKNIIKRRPRINAALFLIDAAFIRSIHNI